jgi:hypothetical protein
MKTSTSFSASSIKAPSLGNLSLRWSATRRDDPGAPLFDAEPSEEFTAGSTSAVCAAQRLVAAALVGAGNRG